MAPVFFKLGAKRVIFDVMKSGQTIRQRAHVATALNIVLAPQRIESAAIAPDMSREQREVDKSQNVVHGVVVFGDSERPTDHRLVGSSISVRHLPNNTRRHTRLTFGICERVGLDNAPVVFERGRRIVDKLLALQARHDDFTRHRIGECDVRPHVEARPQVGPLNGAGSPWIDRVKASSVSNAFQDVMEKYRMRLPGVRAPEKNDVGLFDLLVRVGATTCAENRRQTGDTRSVSSTVTAIDVVASDHQPSEFLRDEIHFVGALGATEKPETLRTVFLNYSHQPLRRAIQRLVPTGRTQGAVASFVTNQRLSEADIRLWLRHRPSAWEYTRKRRWRVARAP